MNAGHNTEIMSNLQIFQFNKGNIRFERRNGSLMVNATDMSKMFGKRPAEWLRLDSTRDHLEALVDFQNNQPNPKVHICTLDTLVDTIHGGQNQGTWMHEDAAIEFARWLNPRFGVEVNQKIKELMTKGSVSLNIPTSFADALELAAAQQREIESMKPKVLFADVISTSKDSFLIRELAKKIAENGVNVGEKRLFAWLRENGYLISGKSASDRNLPTQKSINLGLFEVKESPFRQPDGTIKISKTTMVTNKGRMYFIQKFMSMIA